MSNEISTENLLSYQPPLCSLHNSALIYFNIKPSVSLLCQTCCDDKQPSEQNFLLIDTLIALNKQAREELLQLINS